jgi:hypothetical protein
MPTMLIRRDGACFRAEKSICGKVRNGHNVLQYLTILTLLSDCVLIINVLCVLFSHYVYFALIQPLNLLMFTRSPIRCITSVRMQV